jgi:hypothetical protein
MISDTWLTPIGIIQKLGKFDLDPCTPEIMPWETATKRYTKKEDGLIQDWEGRVWLNPPYSRDAVHWLKKMAVHNNGIALTFARTETSWFFSTIWDYAHSLLFIKGRIYFHDANGVKAPANAGAPSVLVAYGKENGAALIKSGIAGKYIEI